MRLKNALIVVSDIEKSKKFYKDLFGLDVILDGEGNVILTEGLVLQERKVWEQSIRKDVVSEHNASLLYFEESDMESFIERLSHYKEEIKFVTSFSETEWGQKLIRFYDLDGNLIEVRTPM